MMENAKLIKIDRNGSKHYEGYVECDRCQGRGEYWWGAMINGAPQYAGVCFKCEGAGKVWGSWIERTPEYQAKLDARRAAKWAKVDAERAAAKAEREAKAANEKAEREAAEAARKAISQHVGQIGERITATVTLKKQINFEVPAYCGYGTSTITLYLFTDENGNTLAWKTTGSLGRWSEDGRHYIAPQEGDSITIKGTISGHGEYQGEKQTELQRVKRI